MTFPGKKPSSTLKNLGRKFTSLFYESDLDKPIPKHSDMQEQALKYYLEGHKKFLMKMEFKPGRPDYVNCVGGIYRVYGQLREQCVCRGNADQYGSTLPRWAPTVSKVYTVLHSIADHRARGGGGVREDIDKNM